MTEPEDKPDELQERLRQAELLLGDARNKLIAASGLARDDFRDKHGFGALAGQIDLYFSGRPAEATVIEELRRRVEHVATWNGIVLERIGHIQRALASTKITRGTRDKFHERYPSSDIEHCIRDFHLWVLDEDTRFDHETFERVNTAFLQFAKRWSKGANGSGYMRGARADGR